jgi:hypothetical protein
MDLRSYYKKVREAEAALKGDYFVLASLETSEGGRAGVCTEAGRHTAARLIAETRARLATEEEARNFHETHRAAKEAHEQEEAARRVQVMVIPSQELKKPKEVKERS